MIFFVLILSYEVNYYNFVHSIFSFTNSVSSGTEVYSTRTARRSDSKQVFCR